MKSPALEHIINRISFNSAHLLTEGGEGTQNLAELARFSSKSRTHPVQAICIQKQAPINGDKKTQNFYSECAQSIDFTDNDVTKI